jgi:hypothetical protein
VIECGESLFTYPNGRPFSSYRNENFNPVFVIPEIVSQEIRDVCGTNYECTYDYYVTGDENLGRLSANFSDQFEVITNIIVTGKYELLTITVRNYKKFPQNCSFAKEVPMEAMVIQTRLDRETEHRTSCDE